MNFLADNQFTVHTVDADVRQEEHIPKMQNDIGRCKSKLRVLRQPADF